MPAVFIIKGKHSCGWECNWSNQNLIKQDSTEQQKYNVSHVGYVKLWSSNVIK